MVLLQQSRSFSDIWPILATHASAGTMICRNIINTNCPVPIVQYHCQLPSGAGFRSKLQPSWFPWTSFLLLSSDLWWGVCGTANRDIVNTYCPVPIGQCHCQLPSGAAGFRPKLQPSWVPLTSFPTYGEGFDCGTWYHGGAFCLLTVWGGFHCLCSFLCASTYLLPHFWSNCHLPTLTIMCRCLQQRRMLHFNLVCDPFLFFCNGPRAYPHLVKAPHLLFANSCLHRA